MLVHEEAKIYKVELPMPFELDHINCYAVKGENGWSLVDCGMNDEPSFLLWQEFMEVNGIKPGDIKGIYLTHSHLDHCGLAGRLHQLSGAPVYISGPEAKADERFRSAGKANKFAEQLIKNGMPPALASKMDDFFEMEFEQQLPALNIIEPGEKVSLGDLEYSVVLTPGHTDGHICFYNEELGILFSGDSILPEISPNISLWSWTIPNPVNEYMEALETCQKLFCKLVLPAHGEPFANLAERISVLKEIHKEKLDLIKSLAVKETTVYKVVQRIYGETLNTLNMGLAMGEIYAHLMFLHYKGELQFYEKEGKYFFGSAG